MKASGAHLVVLALLGVCLPLQAALAETTIEAATRWGLLGEWSADCNGPARANFVVRDGQLWLDYINRDVYLPSRVESATVRPDNRFELVGLNREQRRFQTVYGKDASGRITVMESKFVDTGQYSIRDGVLVGSGAPSGWFSRCR